MHFPVTPSDPAIFKPSPWVAKRRYDSLPLEQRSSATIAFPLEQRSSATIAFPLGGRWVEALPKLG